MIVYQSDYGSTRSYAEELARRLGTTAFPMDNYTDDGGPVIAFSPVHGPSIPAVKFVQENDFSGRKVAVCVVGMSLVETAREKDQAGKMLGDASPITRFYLPGRMYYSELTPAHRTVMTGIITALRVKPRKSANDEAMVQAYNQDVDKRDMDLLDEIVAWAR